MPPSSTLISPPSLTQARSAGPSDPRPAQRLEAERLMEQSATLLRGGAPAGALLQAARALLLQDRAEVVVSELLHRALLERCSEAEMVDALHLLGLYHHRHGDLEAAEVNLRRALLLAGHFPSVQGGIPGAESEARLSVPDAPLSVGALHTRFRETGFAVIDGLLGTDRCHRIRAEAEALYTDGHLVPGTFYRDEPTDPGAVVHRQCNKLRAQVDELVAAGISLPAFTSATGSLWSLILHWELEGGPPLLPLEFQVARLPGEGGRYDSHTDETDALAWERRVTALYYLNPAWTDKDGGELRLQGLQGPVVLEPRGDRLVLFQSQLLHEVLPTQIARYSLTVWTWGPREHWDDPALEEAQMERT